MIRLRDIRTLVVKELTEILRDRRTLFVMLVMPFLTYPLIIIVMLQLTLSQTRRIESQPAVIVLSGSETDPAFTAHVRNAAPERNWTIVLPEGDGAPATAVLAGEYAAAVRVESADGTGTGQGRITILYTAADEKSRMVADEFRGVCMEYSGVIVIGRLTAIGRDKTFIEPYHVEERNIAPAEKVGAYVFGRNITLVMIIMVVIGAFYPALDTTAGERERRTLETLLASPAGRMEIALAKYAAVLICSFVTGVLNLASMTITFAFLMPAEVAARFPVMLAPFTIMIMILVLIPLAAFVSAVFLGFATFARSYREGQSYLSPLIMLLTLPAMVTLVPGARLTPWTALIPVANIALLSGDLMLRQLPVINALIALAATGFYAWLGITWSARLFDTEELLYRVGNPFRRKTFTAVHAFLCAAAALAALVLVPGIFRSGGPAYIAEIIAPQAVFALIAVMSVFISGLKPRAVLNLRMARPAAALGGIVFTAGVVILLGCLFREGAEQDRVFMEQVFSRYGLGTAGALALVAFLPGITEELLFRGPVLNGFTASFGRWKGALLCGLVFGFVHIVPHKIVPTAMLGMALAVVVIKTGSIFPAMAAHILNNIFGVLQIRSGSAEVSGPILSMLPLGLTLAVLGFILMDPGILRRKSVPERT